MSMTAALIGSAIAGAASQGGLGFGLAAFNNKKAAEMAERDRYENFMYNEQAAAAADARTRKLYEDLQSPAALLAQYKAAGLSPSLMFGGGGGAGGNVPQGAQGQGANGMQTTFTAINPFDVASISLANAQARKLNAEADTEEGKNERGELELEQIREQLKGTWLENEFKAINNRMADINAALQTDKGELEIQKLGYELESMRAGLQAQVMANKITEETMQSTIKFLNNRIKEQTAKILVANSQIKLNNEQAKKLANDILVDNANVDIHRGHLDLDADKLEAQIGQWGIENGLATQENYREWAKLVINTLQNRKDRKSKEFLGIIGLLNILR